MEQLFMDILKIFITLRCRQLGGRGMDHKQDGDEDEAIANSDKNKQQRERWGVCPCPPLIPDEA